ncbi:hypothetical protein BDR26DRAFT_434100 [Obelidium mucronatum]|nr:hypothetical protein BDR26DRAFT_434100 [Obelidium mucronatum]
MRRINSRTRSQRSLGMLWWGLIVIPTKPFTVVVTDQGFLSILYNDSISADVRGWIKGLWGSKKVEDGLLATYNLCRDPKISSPTCISFVRSNGNASGQPQTVNGAPVDNLTFLTGHEDGSVCMWDWSVQAEDISAVKSIPLKFGTYLGLWFLHLGLRGSKAVAVVVDNKTVAIWDGVSTGLSSVKVLVAPGNMPDIANGGSDRGSYNGLRRSSSSVWSMNGMFDQSMVRSTVIAFSNHSDQVLATGEPDGAVNIWYLDPKTRRALLTHPDRSFSNIAVLAIGWSSDDGAVVSLCEDKRVTVHGADSGELIWIHDLWMISPPLKVASFVSGARQLSAVDVYGSLTVVNLHWKVALVESSGVQQNAFGSIEECVDFLCV